MAYTRPPSKSAGDVFDLTAYNAIRDSLIAGVDQVTTKGDLLVATGADTVIRVGVGANDSILVADSAQSAGVAWQIQPAVFATKSGAQDPATSTWVALSWDTESFDTDGMHSTVSNNSRLTVPSNGAGLYGVGATIGFLTNALTPGTSGQYGVRFRVDGATNFTLHFDEAEMQSQDLWVSVQMLASMNVATYIETLVWTSQNVNISGDSFMWAEWLRRQ